MTLPNPWLYVVCVANIPLGAYCTREDALASLELSGRFGELFTLYDTEDHTIVGFDAGGGGEIVVQKLCFSPQPHSVFRG